MIPEKKVLQPNAAAFATSVNQYPLMENDKIPAQNPTNEVDHDKIQESFLMVHTTTTEKYVVPKIVLPLHGKHDDMLKLISDDVNFDVQDSNEHLAYVVGPPALQGSARPAAETATRDVLIEPLTTTTSTTRRPVASGKTSLTRYRKKKPLRKKQGELKFNVFLLLNDLLYFLYRNKIKHIMFFFCNIPT